ncbi:hypothetical protein [Pandoraea aquatica]|uniref:hypothetical protein n=1 Tax=Pandoraea aquatica TaxID=2508290 RepID=UPI0012401E79|nr:hypothetical protein [Pandoraea aquatica]
MQSRSSVWLSCGIVVSVAIHVIALLLLSRWDAFSSTTQQTPVLTVYFVEPSKQQGATVAESQPARAMHSRTMSAGSASEPKSSATVPEPSPVVEPSLPKDDAASILPDWRQSVTSFVRSVERQGAGSVAEEAVTRQSSSADDPLSERAGRMTSEVAEAFEAALGKGWRSLGTLSGDVRPDGSRLERIQTATGLYCVRIPGQVTSIDPFVKRERPLVAVEC